MSKGRLFVTGGNGFTGLHLIRAARMQGWVAAALDGHLEDVAEIGRQMTDFAPDAVLHLAAISSVTHEDLSEIYRVNVLGTENLLKAIVGSPRLPTKIVLASSAAVYGNRTEGLLSESTLPEPVSHYGISKLAMEYVARTFQHQIPIVIARPFNYTGVGHDERFVVPKIVGNFLRKNQTIELGDLEVEREFNDVRFVVETYLALLDLGQAGEVYNICSGRPVKLKKVIETLVEITGFNPQITVNPAFLRANEVKMLAGSPSKLNLLIPSSNEFALRDMILWMVNGE